MTMSVGDIVLTCCNDACGISFAVPQWWYQGKQETRKTFYCPNGHGQHFTGETEQDKLRRERDIARQQLARVEQESSHNERMRLKAEREAKRLKKRASAGTCPCCNRSVRQMALHMKTKHPDFIADETTNVVDLKKKA